MQDFLKKFMIYCVIGNCEAIITKKLKFLTYELLRKKSVTNRHTYDGVRGIGFSQMNENLKENYFLKYVS